MTDENRKSDDLKLRGPDGFRGSDGFQGSEDDALDRELDVALSQYAAVEPRSGLEARILANLQAQRTQIPERVWWRWGIAATVAAVILVAVALMWKSGRSAQQQIVQHPSIQRSPEKSPPQVAANDEHSAVRNAITPPRRTSVHPPQPATVATAAANPKLDVFPSPQPLSEQEKVLLEYVHRSPVEAARIARAQTELAESEELERTGPAPGKGEPRNKMGISE
jgi:hypothetical protein